MYKYIYLLVYVELKREHTEEGWTPITKDVDAGTQTRPSMHTENVEIISHSVHFISNFFLIFFFDFFVIF